MSNNRVRPKSEPVLVRFPEWMMGGDPKSLGPVCGWVIKEAPESGVWLLASKEGIVGSNGNLLRMTKMADKHNAKSEGAFSPMRRLKKHDKTGSELLWNKAKVAHGHLTEIYPDEDSAMLMSMSVLISGSPTAAIASTVTQQLFLEYLLPVAEEPSAYLVEISDTLSYRYTLMRALLATKDDKNGETHTTGSLSSRSSRGLFSDTTMSFSSYLACMCASLSPAIWAYTIGRPGAVIIMFFGTAISGQTSLPRDIIQLLSPESRSPEEENLATQISPRAYIQAAQWWVEQLSTLFSIVTDPANYVDDGVFDPAAATERLLSVEQMFRDCQSILTLTRDDHAKTSLAFTFLKRLEGLLPGYNWKKVVGRGSLESIVAGLSRELPPEIHQIYLPRAKRGVLAVSSLEDGFFIASKESGGPIHLPNKHGVQIQTERRTAVTEWLLLIRNSLHGFDKPSARDRALLAAHDGNIPSEFADVAWLHLLDIVAHPEKLAKFEHLRNKATSEPKQRKQ